MSTLITRDYLPYGLGPRAAWLTNFVSVLDSGTNAADLGVTPAQLADLQNAQRWYDYTLDTLAPYARSYSENLTMLVNDIDTDKTPQELVLPVWSPPAPATVLADTQSGAMNRVIALIDGTILKSSKLTPNLKTQLKLDPLPTPEPGDPSIKKYVALPDGAIDLTISSAKQTVVESMRGDETAFTLLDKVVGTHVYDNRPNLVPGRPEARQYRTRRSDGTAAYGNYSAVFSVTTQA